MNGKKQRKPIDYKKTQVKQIDALLDKYYLPGDPDEQQIRQSQPI